MADTERYCEAVLFPATRVDPAEYCENEAEDGRDYCAEHHEPDYDYFRDW